MDETLNSVNAEQSPVVEGQTTATESVSVEVAAPQKPQTPDQNAEYAKVRRDAESKARDAVYAELYGEEYGIKSKSDYDAYIAKQQEEQERETFKETNGIDPTIIDERTMAVLEKHPLFQTVKEQQNKLIRDNAALELAKISTSLGITDEIKSWADVEKLPRFEQIKDSVMAGNDIVSAAKLAYFDDIVTGATSKAQQETINKLNANAQSSPGSLSNSEAGESFFTREQVDAMSIDAVKKNYPQIMASMKRWT